MTSQNWETLFRKITKISFYILFILVPLILTPFNYELFEFNKMLAVYALTAIIAGAWVGRMICQRRILFKRTPFDIPLLIFLFSQILSSLFSIDRHTSFFGYYSRFHGGLLSTICYLLLYWAFVSNANSRIDTNDNRINPNRKTFGIIRDNIRDYSGQGAKFVKNCLFTSLFTGLIVSCYGIAEHFGIDASLWVQDVRNRVFSTLGQPNWLAAYLAVLIPITLGFAMKSKVLLYLCLYLLLALCFFYTKSQSGLFGLGFSLAVFWLIIFLQNFRQKFFPQKQLFFWFLILNSCFLLLFSTVGVNAYPQIANFFNKFGLAGKSSSPSAITQPASPQGGPPTPITSTALEIGGSASSEIRKIVWKGALEIWKHYPLFGSGVETFAYSYYNFRPIEHNLISEWDFLYNKAHNEYLNFLATTGLVGLGSYLILICAYIFWSVKQIAISLARYLDKKGINDITRYQYNEITITALFSGWLSILITNFFGFSVVPIAIFFFLIPAFCVVLAEPDISRQSSVISHQPSVISHQSSAVSRFQKFGFLILLISESWLLLTVLNFWRADFHYAKGEKYNKSKRQDLAFGELMKAIDLNGGEPVYRNEIAESAAYLALYSFQQKETTSASKLMQVALSQTEEALKVSPRNLNFRKGQIKVLYSLSQIDKSLIPLVAESLSETIKLAPTDPKLRYNLGVIYGSYNEPEKAIKSFKKAIDLKPNYYDARYALAIYLGESGKKQEAREQLEYILNNIAPGDSPSAKLLNGLK